MALASLGALGGSGGLAGGLSSWGSLGKDLYGAIAGAGLSAKVTPEVWSGGITGSVAGVPGLCTMAWSWWARAVGLTAVLGLLRLLGPGVSSGSSSGAFKALNLVLQGHTRMPGTYRCAIDVSAGHRMTCVPLAGDKSGRAASVGKGRGKKLVLVCPCSHLGCQWRRESGI